ncbi:YbhB/YbcL family Raf kinase inhibitor-like protein [Candidatus Woesearchaeota archaeon]|nr:YbhB/YbcL family Raf kinase inhibitor-like protein [Candidatus Woesearchaeota archaeon]
MRLLSPAFQNNEDIPPKYTCQGPDISPPLQIKDASIDVKSFVLIVEDPDAPDPDAPKMVWDHWIVWNIPGDTEHIAENTIPGVQGLNSWGRNEYGGPCPPIGKHRYFFKLYALDIELDIPEASDKAAVLKAIEGHVLEKAEIVGLYKKT